MIMGIVIYIYIIINYIENLVPTFKQKYWCVSANVPIYIYIITYFVTAVDSDNNIIIIYISIFVEVYPWTLIAMNMFW